MPGLYFEIIVCIVAAGLIGLLCGWMMLRRDYNRRLASNKRTWENKYTDFAHKSDIEVQDLERQLQELAEDLKEKNALNRELEDTVRQLETQSHKAHEDALQANKTTTEAQSRMQQLLHAKASALLAENAMEIEAQTFDQTIRLPAPLQRQKTMPALDEYDEEPLDATTVLADSSFDTEESTIALDVETLEALRRSNKS